MSGFAHVSSRDTQRVRTQVPTAFPPAETVTRSVRAVQLPAWRAVCPCPRCPYTHVVLLHRVAVPPLPQSSPRFAHVRCVIGALLRCALQGLVVTVRGAAWWPCRPQRHPDLHSGFHDLLARSRQSLQPCIYVINSVLVRCRETVSFGQGCTFITDTVGLIGLCFPTAMTIGAGT